jgi:hypothetical protein
VLSTVERSDMLIDMSEDKGMCSGEEGLNPTRSELSCTGGSMVISWAQDICTRNVRWWIIYPNLCDSYWMLASFITI